MQAKVTKKSPYGFQVEGREGWISYGKFYKGTKEFNVGALVEYEYKVNGNFTNLMSLIVVQDSPQENSITSISLPGVKLNGNQNVREEIARGTAVKAVLASGAFLAHGREATELLIQRYTEYILSGKMEVLQLEAVANEEK